MRQRTRKLIGTAAMLAFVVIYGPLAMALADSRIAETSTAVQTMIFLVLGIVWILPLLPLIRWMQKPDGA
ncbi:MAG TPA: DUF2842 domain-containing protein [Microvirga sp.]|jgi:Protein of unknown function (DUF2842)|nr:DUF2842 domain-containing protein [Microvirga sp.]